MAADLSDLIDSLKRSINPPGIDLFPTTLDDEWLGRLQDAFWDARLDGLLEGYEVDDDGIVTPLTGTTDLTRDQLQVVVFYAAMNAIYNELRNLKTTFSAKAGPVSYETQQSANMLRDVGQMLKERKAIILARLGDLGSTPTYYIDAVIARTENLIMGWDQYVGHGADPRARGGTGIGFGG